MSTIEHTTFEHDEAATKPVPKDELRACAGLATPEPQPPTKRPVNQATINSAISYYRWAQDNLAKAQQAVESAKAVALELLDGVEPDKDGTRRIAATPRWVKGEDGEDHLVVDVLTRVQQTQVDYDPTVIRNGLRRHGKRSLWRTKLRVEGLNRKAYEAAVTNGEIPADVVAAARSTKPKAPSVLYTEKRSLS